MDGLQSPIRSLREFDQQATPAKHGVESGWGCTGKNNASFGLGQSKKTIEKADAR
jgi:hypothetical protein